MADKGLERIAVDDLLALESKNEGDENFHLSSLHLSRRALLEITGVPEWDIGKDEVLGFSLQDFADDAVLALQELSLPPATSLSEETLSVLRRRHGGRSAAVAAAIGSLRSEKDAQTRTLLITLVVATLRRLERGSAIPEVVKKPLNIPWNSIVDLHPFAETLRYNSFDHTRDPTFTLTLKTGLGSERSSLVRKKMAAVLPPAVFQALVK